MNYGRPGYRSSWHGCKRSEAPPLGATTLISKFTRRSPEMLPDWAPIPWPVWQAEHENPSLIWRACSLKLVLFMIWLRSWHLAHKA